ncbi:MAG: GGDEF domain-containing protein [Actinomycetia bacterium]|nr:GGDEF domain-containing protein [Actinomycetes bacterium]
MPLAAELAAALAEQFPFLVVLLDPELQIIWASRAAADILGYDPSELVGRNIVEMLHPDDMAEVAPMMAAILEQQKETLERPPAAVALELPVRALHKTGTWVPGTATGRVLNENCYLLGVIRPTAERHSIDRVLDSLVAGAELSEVLESLMELLRIQFGLDWVCLVHDFDGVATHLCDGHHDRIENSAEILASVRDTPNDATFGLRRWVVGVPENNRKSVHAAFVMPNPRDEGPNPWDEMILGRAVSLASLAFARAGDDRRLRHAASTDHLTALPNRRAFEDRIEQLNSRADDFPVAVFFVDADRFKSINDRHGHTVGDETLASIAERLVLATREGDFVGRIGGDEFAVCAPGMDSVQAAATRERIAAAFDKPVATAAGDLDVSVSIGTAMAETADDLEQIVARSDADMYARKSGGYPVTRHSD